MSAWEEQQWITLPYLQWEREVVRVFVRKQDRARLLLAIARLECMASRELAARSGTALPILFMLVRLLRAFRNCNELQRYAREIAQHFPDSPEEAFARGFLSETLAEIAKEEKERERHSCGAYHAYSEAWDRALEGSAHDTYARWAFATFMRRWQDRRLGKRQPVFRGKITWEEFQEYRRRHAV